jgi:response regulator RpfG family c-di-GMP phosphodiesterase
MPIFELHGGVTMDIRSETATIENADSDLVFASDDNAQAGAIEGNWKVLIVDDEPEVHEVTKLALRHFSFENKGLTFLHAYTCDEAKKLIGDNPDTAVILLDVVMETDDAGLEVARYIRERLGNQMVRIILRTGQPGAAPEKDVIVNWEINEYKTKTELTSQKLFTTFIATLRNYRDLRMIEGHRRGLEKIVDASGSLFEIQSMEQFMSGVLTQITALLNVAGEAICCTTTCFASAEPHGDIMVLAGTGAYANCNNKRAEEVLPASVAQDLQRASKEKKSLFFDDRSVIFFNNKSGKCSMVFLEGVNSIKQVDKRLLEVFCANTSIAIDNILLKQEIQDTQKEVVYRMGAIAETRSKETGNHVKRVAEYSKLLALKYGMPAKDAELIKQASPMHDIGKVGIPDSILNKPGKHTPEEWEIMKTHAQIGYDMLQGSQYHILKAAATVALTHHEKWDGSGYPNGLKGEDIHIFGRITALADVFDALGSDRCYKKAWPLDDILDLLKRESGKHFDPKLVELMLGNLSEFLVIRDALVDE